MAIIRNIVTQRIVADQAAVARGWLQRALGLLPKASLREGEGLVFPRCNAIHTCFMRFPIDVVFLRGTGVIKLVGHVKPFRVVGSVRANAVIELPDGTIPRTALQRGHILEVEEGPFEGQKWGPDA